MYQMAMTLLEQQAGPSSFGEHLQLYELEDKFDSEYSEIMTLSKEAECGSEECWPATTSQERIRTPTSGNESNRASVG